MDNNSTEHKAVLDEERYYEDGCPICKVCGGGIAVLAPTTFIHEP